MAEKIKLMRTPTGAGTEQFNDADLRRIADYGKQKCGLAFRPGVTIHNYASKLLSEQANALHFSSNRVLVDCFKRVSAMEQNRHLVFLCRCDLVDDRHADVQIMEASDANH